MATAGLTRLSLNGFGFGFGFGEGVTLLATAFYALHIIGLGRYSSPASAAGPSTVQMIVIAAVSLVSSAPRGINLPTDRGVWVSVLYMALIAGSAAIWAQTWAQSHLPATRAAIVMTLEPVFASRVRQDVGRPVTDHRDVCRRSHDPCGDAHRGAHRPQG